MSEDTARVQCGKCGNDLVTEEFPTANSIVKCENCGTSGRYEDVMGEATKQILDDIAKGFRKDFNIDFKF